MASTLESPVPGTGCSKSASSDGKDVEEAECGTALGTPQQGGIIIHLVGIGGPFEKVHVKLGGIEPAFKEVCRVAARGLGSLQAHIDMLWGTQSLSLDLFEQLVTSGGSSSFNITVLREKPGAKAFRAVAELVAASHIDLESGLVKCGLEPFLHKPFVCRVRNFPVGVPMARQITECRCFKHNGCKILKSRSRWSNDMALTWFYSGLRPEVDSAQAHMDLVTTVEEMQLH